MGIKINLDECIGCGVCVEVCPANRRNGGQTLRVMAAPAAGWERALDGLPIEDFGDPADKELS